MRKIKFSHQYNKMPLNCKKAYVLDVWALRREALSPAFIDYDTKTTKGDHYKLPRVKVYLVIMLWTDGHLWTTIRSGTHEKMAYYKNLIGKEVNIEVKSSS